MRERIEGLCPACNEWFDSIDDEKAECSNCAAIVHDSCIVSCAQCGHEGCRGCLTFDIDEGEFFCAEDCRDAWLAGWSRKTQAMHRKLLHTGSAEDLHAWLKARKTS